MPLADSLVALASLAGSTVVAAAVTSDQLSQRLKVISYRATGDVPGELAQFTARLSWAARNFA